MLKNKNNYQINDYVIYRDFILTFITTLFNFVLYYPRFGNYY